MSSSPNLLAIKRQKFWHSQLSATSKVLTLTPPSTGQSLPLVTCLENVIANVRAKILEVSIYFWYFDQVMVSDLVHSLLSAA